MEQPLACVRVVCAGQPSVHALPHVARTIDAFTFGDGGLWTLEGASKRGFLRLLDPLLTRERFNQDCRKMRLGFAVGAAIQRGYDVSVLDWWLKRYMPDQKVVSMDWILELAIRHARILVLEWLYRETNGHLPHLGQIVDCEDPNVIVWLYEHGRRHSSAKLYFPQCLNQFTFQCARQCLSYEVEGASFKAYCIDRVAEKAITCNLFEQVQWLYECRPSLFQPHHLSGGVSCGHLEVVKWLYEKFPEHFFDDPRFVSHTFQSPSSSTFDLGIFRWLLCEFDWADEKNRLKWVKAAMVFAAWKGSLEMLEIVSNIRAESSTCDQSVFIGNEDANDLVLCQALLEGAAVNGHLLIIQWIRARSSQVFTPLAMDRAAENGRLAAVQWLHQNCHEGCTPDAINGAAANGHLEVVQWLHENRPEGCTTNAMDLAASGGHLHVVKWLHENRSEGCTTAAMDLAAQYGHLDVIKWLHENRSEGCTVTPTISAMQNEHMKRNERGTISAMNAAVTNGHLDVVRFLHINRREHCTRRAMDSAARGGYFDTFKWLQKNRSQPFPASGKKEWRQLAQFPNSYLTCMALYTTHNRVGWIVDRFVRIGDFETAELLISDARAKGVTLVESKYVGSL